MYNTSTDEYTIDIDSTQKQYLPLSMKTALNVGKTKLTGIAAKRFISMRVIPPDRQGISGLYEAIGIKKYDMFAILMFYKGKCNYDQMYLEEF